MDVIHGFTQCWVPGPTCMVDWTAWAAIAAAAAVMTTVLATIVALFVGCLPVAMRLVNGRDRAKTVATVFLAELDLAVFWIAVGYQLAKLNPGEPSHYNNGIGFAMNCQKIDVHQIMGEIEFFPRDVASSAANCAVKIIEFQRMVCTNDGRPMHAPEDFSVVPTGFDQINNMLYGILDLQAKLHHWIFKQAPSDTMKAAQPVALKAQRGILDPDAFE